MITDVIFHRLTCDKCGLYLENPDPQHGSQLWEDDQDMKVNALNKGWAITHEFHLCKQCKEGKKDEQIGD